MAEKAGFQLRHRNPDVLTCIANLSNDEVFTPPELANRMLDDLAAAWAAGNDGEDIWANPDVTFLDPSAKTGVFLREVTVRLTKGLEYKIPGIEDRVDHILTKQVFGVAVTQLTSLLARRTIYCSKFADGPHSIAKSFRSAQGNIWFERMEHEWVGGTDRIVTSDASGNEIEEAVNGRCAYCGAGRRMLDRVDGFESHAYAFIHTNSIKTRIAELFGEEVQFDVIIGNPPYQLADGGQGASAVPIYDKFITQAMALEPRFLSMVIPARWLFGGRGLDVFRKTMLGDKRVRKLVDYADSRQVFSSVDVAGGVCYFLWDRDHAGDCEVVTHDAQMNPTASRRPLLEDGAEVFVRSEAGLAILRKIVLAETGMAGVVLPPEKRFETQVSGQKPFGLRTFFRGSEVKTHGDDVLVLQSGGRAWAGRETISEGRHLVDKWKTFTSKSSSEHAGQADKNGMRRVLSLSGVLPPGSVVTETYVLIGTFDSEAEARNCLAYAMTKFFRFLVATRTSAQDLPRSAYAFVPVQDYSRLWTDQDLYKKYGLTEQEIGLIESTIRPMDAVDA